MRFIPILAAIAFAALASAQNTTSSCWYYGSANSCLGNGCTWCFDPTDSATMTDSFGDCKSNGTACTSSTYNTTLTNPCPALTTQTLCTANIACGWCASSSKCFYVGFTSNSYSPSTGSSLCSGVNLVRKSTCATAPVTTKAECYNLPYGCSWCSGACASFGTCTDLDSYNCASWSTRSTCVSYTVSAYINTGGACGWCAGYYSTNVGMCQYYSSGAPSTCTGTFTYNTDFGSGAAALALAVGLVGAVLIVVVVIPLVCVACIIGCSVYFCCIRPKQQVVVVQGGNQPYVPMNQGKV